jgi:hypothetical protein
LRKQSNSLSAKHGENEQRWRNSRPKAGSGRSTAAVPLSNRMVAIEPVFVHANEITLFLPSFLRLAISFSASQGCAIYPSATPESHEIRENP